MTYRVIDNLFKATLRIPVGGSLIYESNFRPNTIEIDRACRYLANYKWIKLQSTKYLITKSKLLSPDEIVEWTASKLLNKQAKRKVDRRNPMPSTWLHIPLDYEGGEYQFFQLLQKSFQESKLDVELSYIVGDNNHMMKVHYYGEKVSE